MIVRALIVAASLVAAIGARAADPRADTPDVRIVSALATPAPPSYEAALRDWRGARDVNDWIGSHFAYDARRAMLLSETQRGAARLAIHRPEDFYAQPSGVCVDLARFGVETLRAIDPEARPFYLMIEFAPLAIAGEVLRRHWLAGFEHGGRRWFFADSKRPGHLAGPYEVTKAFVDDYAAYRHRDVVTFRELASYERATRTLATKRVRGEGAAPP